MSAEHPLRAFIASSPAASSGREPILKRLPPHPFSGKIADFPPTLDKMIPFVDARKAPLFMGVSGAEAVSFAPIKKLLTTASGMPVECSGYGSWQRNGQSSGAFPARLHPPLAPPNCFISP